MKILLSPPRLAWIMLLGLVLPLAARAQELAPPLEDLAPAAGPGGAGRGELGIRLKYTVGGAEVIITRDAAGLVQFDGLPYPGLVLYRPSNGVVYYQHPTSPLWLIVQPGQAPAVSSTLVAGPSWQPWDNQPTQRWDVFASDDYGHKSGKQCDQWFASAAAGQQAGLTVADLSRVLGTLRWLNAGGRSPACDQLLPTTTQGLKVGLPLRWVTPDGPWQLTELVRTAVAPITLPEAVKPLDDTARLQLLLSQFGKEQRENFVRANSNLPVAAQVELIEKAVDVGGGEAEDH